MAARFRRGKQSPNFPLGQESGLAQLIERRTPLSVTRVRTPSGEQEKHEGFFRVKDVLTRSTNAEIKPSKQGN